MTSSAPPNAFRHPSALIDDGAVIGEQSQIGPYCVIGPNVKIGERVKLHSHVVIEGNTTIGDDCEIWPFAALGTAPQDLKYKGEESQLIIGARNRIREHVTMNPGTSGGGMITRIGDDGLFMVGVHVAHDCQVGNHVIMANQATLAGHVVVGDFAVLGGLSAVHQFVVIGHHAMIGGMSGVEKDVLPYGLVSGERASLQGLNLVGLRRSQVNAEQVRSLQQAYQILFPMSANGVALENFSDRVLSLANSPLGQEVLIQEWVHFIQREAAKRGIVHPKALANT